MKKLVWSSTFGGSQGNAAPNSIAVAATGASVLDQVLAVSGRDPAWTPATGA